ncbi:hypothetical protein JOF55_002642 [Haloactinomyces albus]|uniref:Uncharacterized protein n=1 Tax=Haloactinomyces albus TaxID=1352928 RepID=A0AAE3ZEN7_9ACTN|nr:hypothetical protein [Haloactinomyces albus]
MLVVCGATLAWIFAREVSKNLPSLFLGFLPERAWGQKEPARRVSMLVKLLW